MQRQRGKRGKRQKSVSGPAGHPHCNIINIHQYSTEYRILTKLLFIFRIMEGMIEGIDKITGWRSPIWHSTQPRSGGQLPRMQLGPTLWTGKTQELTEDLPTWTFQGHGRFELYYQCFKNLKIYKGNFGNAWDIWGRIPLQPFIFRSCESSLASVKPCIFFPIALTQSYSLWPPTLCMDFTRSTLPETNTSHLKMDGWKMIHFLLGPGLFSGALLVSGSVNHRKPREMEPTKFLCFLMDFSGLCTVAWWFILSIFRMVKTQMAFWGPIWF